jgi:hypothetical protein
MGTNLRICIKLVSKWYTLMQCVRKVAVRLHKVLEVKSTNVYTGLNLLAPEVGI